MTRYREAFSWTQSVDEFVRWHVTETPLLNVCSGRTDWGDVTLDLHEPADVAGDWTALPFEDDSFGAVFADPPWDSGHKMEEFPGIHTPILLSRYERSRQINIFSEVA